MGFRDLFRGPKPAGSHDLLHALIEALDHENVPVLKQLINENSVAIREQFAGWLKVPDSLRGDRDGLERYARTLTLIGDVFANAGDESLRDLATGRGRDNSVSRWRDELSRAQSLLESRRFDDAVTILRSVLHAMEGACGSAVDYYRARALGSLGIGLAEAGHTAEGIAASREALQICQDTADEEGVRTYTANIQNLESFIALPGEPPCIAVFHDESGKQLTEEELGHVCGTVRWRFRTRGPAHPEASRLHTEGRAAGACGDYAHAIELLSQAAELDPPWPYPLYDRAFARLLLQDFDGALADYRATLKLAPRGFFTASRAADLLSREAEGEFPRGLYAAFAMLEHMPAEAQRNIVRQLVEKFPSCAPAWELHADSLEDPEERLRALEKGLASAPDPDTRGNLLVKKALAERALGNVDAAVAILEELTTQAVSINAWAYARLMLAHVRAHRSGNIIPSGQQRDP